METKVQEQIDKLYKTKEGHKLDIGCGAKWTVMKENNNFEGLDIFDFGQKYVCPVSQLKEKTGMLFDAIRSEHFIEHIPVEESVKMLNDIWEILKPDGVLHIVTPHCLRHHGAWVLTHRSYYTEASFVDLGRDNRWEVFGIRRWKTLLVVTNKRNDIHWYAKPLDK